jgi:hypothetical protein
MANNINVINAVIKIPNILFLSNGDSYTGNYKIAHQNSNITIISSTAIPMTLYFRNSLFAARKNTKLSETELLSKNFQNTKEKLEKIVKFTNSK